LEKNVRVSSHDQRCVWALGPDLANHLCHQRTALLVTTGKKTWDIGRVLDALDCDITAHHGANCGHERRTSDRAHVTKLGGAASKEDGHGFAAAAAGHIVLADAGECGDTESRKEGESEGLHLEGGDDYVITRFRCRIRTGPAWVSMKWKNESDDVE
jgi:hypothetical protein